MHIINGLKKEKISSHIRKVQSNIDQINHHQDLSDALNFLALNYQSRDTAVQQHVSVVREFLKGQFHSIKEAYSFNKILLLNTEGKVFFSTTNTLNLSLQEKNLFNEKEATFLKARHDLTFTPPFPTKGTHGAYHVMALAPIFNRDLQGKKKTTLIVAYEIPMEPIFESVNDTTGLGFTGETILTQYIDNKACFLNPTRRHLVGDEEVPIPLGSEKGIPAQRSVTSSKGGFSENLIDYRGVPVNAAWSQIPELGWGIVTKMDHKECFMLLNKLRQKVIFVSGIAIIIAIFIATLYARNFLKPLIQIEDTISALAQGSFPKEVPSDRNDKFRNISMALNTLINHLKQSTLFAQRIGQGKLDVSIDTSVHSDVLSKSLAAMQKSLSREKDHELERKWLTEGIAIHSEILQSNVDSIQSLGEAILSSLVSYLGVQRGGFYSVLYTPINNENGDEVCFELSATYAYEDQEDRSRKFKLGEGIIGQAAQDCQTIYQKNVPLESPEVSTAFGKAKATNILIVPIKVNEEVLGLLEFAAFEEINEYKIDLVERIADNMASAILSVKSSERMKRLLSDSQRFAQELQKKEEEHLQNQKEMELRFKALQKELLEAKKDSQRLRNKLRALLDNL